MSREQAASQELAGPTAARGLTRDIAGPIGTPVHTVERLVASRSAQMLHVGLSATGTSAAELRSHNACLGTEEQQGAACLALPLRGMRCEVVRTT